MRVEVGHAYNGGNTRKSLSETSQTTIQMSQTAMTLDLSVVEALGAILKEGSTEVTVNTKQLESTDLSFVIADNDCRVFKKFVAFHSLRGFEALFSEKDTTIQVDTLYRLRDVCERNDYRAVWRNITQFYELCASEHQEDEQFKEFMGNDQTDNLGTNREGLLRCTMFVEEPMQDRCNAQSLPSFFKAFKKHRWQLYADRAAFCGVTGNLTSDSTEDKAFFGADVAKSSEEVQLRNGEEPIAKMQEEMIVTSMTTLLGMATFQKG